MSKRLESKAMTISRLARICPACFGGLESRSQGDARILLCADGNFQQRRRKRNDAITEPFWKDPIFVSDEDVDLMHASVKTTRGQANVQEEQGCASDYISSLEAPKASISRFDVTGLMALTCRHDNPVAVCNITTGGEGHHYVLALLQAFMIVVDGIVDRVGVAYDVGCSMHRAILLHQYEPKWFGNDRLLWAIGAWHAYGHSYGCQVHYNTRRVDEFGVTDGESVERLWSLLANLVNTTRSMRRVHREATLCLRFASLCRRNWINLFANLCRRAQHTVEVNQKSTKMAKSRIALLCQAPLAPHWAEVVQWLLKETDFAPDVHDTLATATMPQQAHHTLLCVKRLIGERKARHAPFEHKARLSKSRPVEISDADVASGTKLALGFTAQTRRLHDAHHHALQLRSALWEYSVVQTNLSARGMHAPVGTSVADQLIRQASKRIAVVKATHTSLSTAIEVFNSKITPLKDGLANTRSPDRFDYERLTIQITFAMGVDELLRDAKKARHQQQPVNLIGPASRLDALISDLDIEEVPAGPWLHPVIGGFVRDAMDALQVRQRCEEEVARLAEEALNARQWLASERKRLTEVPESRAHLHDGDFECCAFLAVVWKTGCERLLTLLDNSSPASALVARSERATRLLARLTTDVSVDTRTRSGPHPPQDLAAPGGPANEKLQTAREPGVRRELHDMVIARRDRAALAIADGSLGAPAEIETVATDALVEELEDAGLAVLADDGHLRPLYEDQAQVYDDDDEEVDVQARGLDS